MVNEHSLAERIAVLETKMEKLNDIDRKLDELLDLKSKWAGGIWLVTIILGSGILGLIGAVMSWFNNRPHL